MWINVGLIETLWKQLIILEKLLQFGIKTPFGTFLGIKKRLLAHLNSIYHSTTYLISMYLKNLENSLITKYNNILRLEDDYWKLYSRID